MSESAALDPTTQSFFEGIARHELRVQRCRSCETFQHYPRPFCLACESDEIDWVTLAGNGTVYSMTRVHRQVLEDLPVPYVVGLVELDEGPRLLALLADEDIAIGERVAPTWQRFEGVSTPLVFRRR